MKSKMFMSMLVIALAAALVGGATMALFTATATNAGNTFTAGTVIVEVDGVGEAAIPVNITDMAPGDVHTGNFVVRNTGTLRLRYSVSTATSGALFTVQDPAPGNTPAEVALTANHTNIELAPGAEATVTFTVTLPSAAGNQYQGDSGTVDFTINAVQTANNPLP